MSEERVTNVMGDIGDVLNKMNRVNETFTYEVWVPSLNKNVMFREISTGQQERLIKSIIDSPVFNTEFIFALKKIIEENCAEKIDITALTIIDKLFIALKMRSVSIGDTLELRFNVKGLEKPVQRGVSLEDIIEKSKEVLNPPAKKLIEGSTYKIECCIPTIETEYRLENDLRRNSTEGTDVKDTKQMRKLVGDVFLSEIVKYVSKLTIVDSEEETTIDMSDLGFRNRISIIEKLPSRLLKEIIEYITSVNEEISKVVLVKTKVTVEENDETVEKDVEERLTVDGGFFTSS